MFVLEWKLKLVKIKFINATSCVCTGTCLDVTVVTSNSSSTNNNCYDRSFDVTTKNELIGMTCLVSIPKQSDTKQLFTMIQSTTRNKNGTNTSNSSSSTCSNDTSKWISLVDENNNDNKEDNSNQNNNDSSNAIVFLFSSKLGTEQTIDRNRHGTILLHCMEIVQFQNQEQPNELSSSFRTSIKMTSDDENNIDDNEIMDTDPTITKSIQSDHNNNNNNNNTNNNNACCWLSNSKKERHHLFAKWIVNEYGLDYLCNPTKTGIVDVAGGNGELTKELIQLGIQTITLIDPNPRLSSLSSWIMKDRTITILPYPLEGDGSNLLNNNRMSDDDDDTKKRDNNNTTGSNNIVVLTKYEKEQIQNATLIVGMHPDQATESIVQLAVRLHIPFAIVPCCVMPKLFPHRRLVPEGSLVRSYRSFCQYLLQMAPSKTTTLLVVDNNDEDDDGTTQFCIDYLPFLGRNSIIYLPQKKENKKRRRKQNNNS